MTFRWAIIVNKLEQPLGRIALENPKAPGMMIDLGITSPEIGVAVPPDGRKLKMVLKDDSGRPDRGATWSRSSRASGSSFSGKVPAAWSPSGHHRKGSCRRGHRMIRSRSASITCSA